MKKGALLKEGIYVPEEEALMVNYNAIVGVEPEVPAPNALVANEVPAPNALVANEVLGIEVPAMVGIEVPAAAPLPQENAQHENPLLENLLAPQEIQENPVLENLLAPQEIHENPLLENLLAPNEIHPNIPQEPQEVEAVVDVPMEVLVAMHNVGGNNAILVMEKILTPSDVNLNAGRLSIPEKQANYNFLSEFESTVLANENNLAVQILGGDESIIPLRLRKWRVGAGMPLVLTKGWNAFLRTTAFAAGNRIQLWTFSRDQERHFFVRSV